MKNIAIIIDAYAEEKGHYPTCENWAKEISSFRPDDDIKMILKCPNDDSESLSSYALNPAISGKEYKKVKKPDTIIMLTEKTFKGSHNDFIIYADGHPKWVNRKN